MLLRLDVRRVGAGRPPGFLLGCGLNLIRALGRAAIPTVVATSDPASAGLASRYVCGWCRMPPAQAGEPARLDALLAAGEAAARQTGGRAPLFYGNDDDLGFVQRHAEPLQKWFLLLLNEAGLAESLADKERFLALATSRGVPVPRTYAWGEEALAAAPGPLLVKPRTIPGFSGSALADEVFFGGGKAVVFDSAAKLLADAACRRHQADLIVQEYVPGDDDQLYSFHGFSDEGGAILAAFGGRKIRTYPGHTGFSSFLELTRDEGLLRAGRQAAERLGLRGIYKIDFKRDPRDGRFLALEVNARYNLWHYLGAANGLSLPRVAYDYLVHGARSPSPSYLTRYRWVDFMLDVRAFR
jgi:D-aspartate ligase